MGNCYGQPQNQQNLIDLSEPNYTDYSHKDFKQEKQKEQRAGQPVNQLPGVDEDGAAEFYASQQQEVQDDEIQDNNLEDIVTSKETIWDKIVKNSTVDKNKYQNELQKLGQNQFKDQEFPAELKSIAIDINTFPKAKKYKWLRAQEFVKGQIKLFEGKIEPNDIKQGSLGDCYFLSSLSAMAEKPNLIARLFETKEANNQGLYCIWLCCNGEWKQVILDDYFPCQTNPTKNQNEPAFSSGNGPELWVLLLEKAYAKVHGCYANIEAGLTGNAIRDLTGAPYEFKSNQEEGPDKIWEFLQDKNNINTFICTAGSNADLKGTEIKQNTGIISGHAYAILDAQVVKNKEGQEERIIQLRNPWGSNEWTGAWSDKSDKWTPELKKQCNWTDKDDGIFWMPIEDFCKDYSDLTINYVHDDFHYSSFNVQSNFQKYFMIKFKVKKSNSLCYISLSQKNKKCYYGTNIDYDYSMVSLIVFKTHKEGQKLVKQFVHDDYGNQRDTFIKHTFSAGEYTAMVNIEWCQKVHSDVVISAYSGYPVEFDEQSLEYIDQNKFENYIDQCLLLKKTKPNLIVAYKQAPKVFRSKGKLGGYIYYLYLNKSRNMILNETCNLKNRDGVTICPPQLNSDTFSVEVAQMESKFVKYRIDPDKKGAYSYGAGYQTQFRQVNFAFC